MDVYKQNSGAIKKRQKHVDNINDCFFDSDNNDQSGGKSVGGFRKRRRSSSEDDVEESKDLAKP
jgi:hypothetical protein